MPVDLTSTILKNGAGQPANPQPIIAVDLNGNYAGPGGGGSTSVSQTTASNLNAQVVGNTPAATTDSGNPVKVGGKYNITTPTLTDGQRGDLQIDQRGSLNVTIRNVNATGAAMVTMTNNDAVSPQNSLTVFGHGYVYNGATWDRARGDTAGTYTVNAPSVASAVALTPVRTSALASSLVLKSGAGNLYRFTAANTSVTPSWILVFDATAAPADGAVTPIWAKMIAASSSQDFNFDTIPLRFTTGCTVVLSTTGPFTKTASANAFFAGLVA